MQIDRIRLLHDEVAVWLVYAGRARSFLDEFSTTNSIFLSLPGFTASTTVFESDPLTRQHLAMSDKIAQWNFGKISQPPSRAARTYSVNPYASGTPNAKAFASELGNIRRMFRDMKAGDLVLSPRRGQLDPFMIGEVKGNWADGDELPISSLSNELVPVRFVRWLDTALARRDFPPRIARRLKNQHAITRLDDRFYKEIFDLVYPSYAWNDNSKLDVFGDDYRGTDPTQIHPTAILIKYIVASVFAFEAGEISLFHQMPADKAIEAYYDQNLIAHFGQNFNSPGSFSLIVRRKKTAALVAAGIMIATASASGHLPLQLDHAIASVTGAIEGPGKAAQVSTVDDYAHSMTAVDWKKVQSDKGRAARESLTISLSASRQVSAHRDQLNAR